MSLTYLRPLSERYPDTRAALAEIASLQAELTLPKPTVHIVSDVHGEFKKLRHILNNASGSLRPMLQELWKDRLSEADVQELTSLFYYPRETWAKLAATLPDESARRAQLKRLVPRMVEVIRELERRSSVRRLDELFPAPFTNLFRELALATELHRQAAFVDMLIDPFVRHGREEELVRMIARVVRNLSVGEVIVAGDLGDRGPRLDKVIDLIIKQPKSAFTWGNHDASWMGACLGHRACIATVLRVSLRYRRLGQLEEGYGITMAPVEKLARTVYGDDPCERFQCKGEGLRDKQEMARMQKAMAILQFKLEGQLIKRRPDFGMDHRNLLHRIDPKAGTVEIDGRSYPLLDTRLPTIDWSDPYKLSAEEEACMARLQQSFVQSQQLWAHMKFVASHGAMWLKRDRCAIFHGCTPVDDAGEFLPLTIDGEPRKGRALLEALDRVVQRAFQRHQPDDIDMLWYLWTGPVSPCFGKDRMATFETYLVADKNTHKETKNPYFKLIHETGFCAKLCREFGIDEKQGLIVNGHVPVKLEKGETPVKKSGRAVTIDGAFSEAYGDRGYTLVLDSQRIYLAQHHHFESVDEAVSQGADIIPTVSDIEVHDRPRTIGDTEQGDVLRGQIDILEELIKAYEANQLRERD
jgi:fructose-1,6-bisphosphatase-3